MKYITKLKLSTTQINITKNYLKWMTRKYKTVKMLIKGLTILKHNLKIYLKI